MARPQKMKTDKEKWQDYFPISSDNLPNWAEEQYKLDKEIEPDEIFNPIEARALYISQFGDESHADLLELLIAGEEAASSSKINKVIEIIDLCYPKNGLKKGEKLRTASDEAIARARFLRLCLAKLLRHFKFPAVIRNDIDILLAGYPIRVEEKKRNAQKVLLAHPDISYGQISDLIYDEFQTQVNTSDLSQWVKANIVIDPHKASRPPDPKQAWDIGE